MKSRAYAPRGTNERLFEEVEIFEGTEVESETIELCKLIIEKGAVELPEFPMFREIIIHENMDGKKTLVLDLDETMVHCNMSPLPVSYATETDINDLVFRVSHEGTTSKLVAKLRPGLVPFLKQMAQHYRVVVFTASIQLYADPLLDKLNELSGNAISHRLYRDSCVFIEGKFVKDLRILNQNIDQIMVVENSIEAIAFQVDNVIPISSWFNDMQDNQLELISTFLSQPVIFNCRSVPETFRQIYGISDRVRTFQLKKK